MSVDSGNPVRDENVKKAFFALFEEKAAIKGKITRVEGDATRGRFDLEIRMNRQSNAVPMTYQVSDKAIEAIGKFDFLTFKGSKALDSIHQLCLELHKGADGVSKTWSEMGIKLTAPIERKCSSGATGQ